MDELIHLYCCSPLTALCGVDLRGGDDRPGEAATCLVCEDLASLDCEDSCPVVVFS